MDGAGVSLARLGGVLGTEDGLGEIESVGRRWLDSHIGEGGGGGRLSIMSAAGGRRVIIIGARGGRRGDGGWNVANSCSGGVGLLAAEFGVADAEGVGDNLSGGAGDGEAATLL